MAKALVVLSIVVACGSEPTAQPQRDPPPVPEALPSDDMVTIHGGRYLGTEIKCPTKEPATVAAAKRHPGQVEHDVRSFAIDRRRTSCSDYRRCERAGICRDLDSGGMCIDGVASAPVESARAYCAWRKQRLPSYYEWQAAIRGPKGDVYPNGSDTESTCADNGRRASSHPCQFTTANGIDYELYNNFGEWTGDIDCSTEDDRVVMQPVMVDLWPLRLDYGFPTLNGPVQFRCVKDASP